MNNYWKPKNGHIVKTVCDTARDRQESSASPTCSTAQLKVRVKDGQILLVAGGEHVITTDDALYLAEQLKSAAMLKGDY